MGEAFLHPRKLVIDAAHNVEVNGVKIYNAEGYLQKTMDFLTLKKLVKDKKRRRTYEE